VTTASSTGDNNDNGDGGLEADNFVSSWLNGFVQDVGPTVARLLLKDYIGSGDAASTMGAEAVTALQ
jgi:hypothetical protein